MSARKNTAPLFPNCLKGSRRAPGFNPRHSLTLPIKSTSCIFQSSFSLNNGGAKPSVPSEKKDKIGAKAREGKGARLYLNTGYKMVENFRFF